ATENHFIGGYNNIFNEIGTFNPVDDEFTSKSIFKGLARIDNFIYATDFLNKLVKTYDFNFILTTDFPFIDEDKINPLLSNFDPFNIVSINNLLYVSYAQQ